VIIPSGCPIRVTDTAGVDAVAQIRVDAGFNTVVSTAVSETADMDSRVPSCLASDNDVPDCTEPITATDNTSSAVCVSVCACVTVCGTDTGVALIEDDIVAVDVCTDNGTAA